ncbi:tRNA(His) guanylyltransferase Thg1 family protein [Sinomonas sp. RB5]
MTTYVAGEAAAAHFKRAEHAHRTQLPRGSYAVVRVDGKGFSKYTRKLVRPFDPKFSADMQATALFLAAQVQGAVAAYTQSDEISVLLSAPTTSESEVWFGGQVQKIVSITAALATAKFNALRPAHGLAVFDARTHPLDGEEEVDGYLRWRQEDAMKNSVGMLASHHFSHRQLLGVSVARRKRMLLEEDGVSWEELPQHLRQGTHIRRGHHTETVTYRHGRTGEEQPLRSSAANGPPPGAPVRRLGLPRPHLNHRRCRAQFIWGPCGVHHARLAC